jgi:hypothetical protein
MILHVLLAVSFLKTLRGSELYIPAVKCKYGNRHNRSCFRFSSYLLKPNSFEFRFDKKIVEFKPKILETLINLTLNINIF